MATAHDEEPPTPCARQGGTAAVPGVAAGVPASERDVGELWRCYRVDPSDGNRNRLAERYQGLVGRTVGRMAARLPRSVDRGDLQTAGWFGLISAIASYDAGRGVRFEIYAEMRIRGALLDELRNEDWLPRPCRQRLEQRKRTIEELASELGRPPTDEEVAGRLGMGRGEYQSVFGTGLPAAPAVAVRPGDEMGPDLEVLADPKTDVPGEKLTRTELLRLAAQRMSEQEYRIVYLKYWEGLSMREIGELTGLSESRVWKIHARLMERLKLSFQAGA